MSSNIKATLGLYATAASPTKNTGCVCHTVMVALPFYIERYLKAKEKTCEKLQMTKVIQSGKCPALQM
jgi:hypothetical protein